MAPTAPNHDWFKRRLAQRELSQRQLAKLMNLDHAAISRMLRGHRRMTVEEASQLAVLLQSTTADVLQAAGVKVSGGERVRIAAVLHADGSVHPVAEGLHDTVDAPPNIPADALAIQARTGGLEDGWMYFHSATHQRPDECLGAFALVAVRGNGLLLAHVRKGYRPGTYNLVDQQNRQTISAELAWASVVLWIQTGR